jgi:hypothetical protein
VISKEVHKYRLGEEPRDVDYWRTKSYQERLEALELIRKEYIAQNYDADIGFQRVCRVIRLKKST